MHKGKILILLITFFLLVLGSFFVACNINFNGKKEILFKNRQNDENQESFDKKGSDLEIVSAGEQDENIIENQNETETAGENSQKKEKSESPSNVINKLVSWGHQKSSERSIDTVILHSSYNAMGGDEYDTEKLIGEYKEYGVSPHYLIDRKGNIYQLVKDEDIAYHAGESKTPDGRANVNNFSIGIEMMNTKSDKYTAFQYSSLKYTLAYLKEKYKIKYTLGHNDIAKGRKDDPWNFDWNRIK